MNAVLAINENRPADALTTLQTTTDQSPLTRAIMALALHRSGNAVAARSLRDELLSNRQINLANFGDIAARQLVKRIT